MAAADHLQVPSPAWSFDPSRQSTWATPSVVPLLEGKPEILRSPLEQFRRGEDATVVSYDPARHAPLRA